MSTPTDHQEYVRVRKLLVEMLTEIASESFFFRYDSSTEPKDIQLPDEPSALSIHISGVYDQMSDIFKKFFRRERLSRTGWQPSDSDIIACMATERDKCTNKKILIDGKFQGLTLKEIKFFEEFANLLMESPAQQVKNRRRRTNETPAQRVKNRHRQKNALYRQFA